MTPSQKEALIVKRRSELQNREDDCIQQPTNPRWQVSTHNIYPFVNLANLTDYTLCHHDINEKDDGHKKDTLLTSLSARD